MRFSMARSYEGLRDIDTDDLLEAVKTVMNYEADLYVDGRLFISWSGLPVEENIQTLAQAGITTYVVNNTYRFKYTDESKNVQRYFASFYMCPWYEYPYMQIRVHDYRTSKDEIEFSSLEEVIDEGKKYLSVCQPEHIAIQLYGDDGCQFIKLLENGQYQIS